MFSIKSYSEKTPNANCMQVEFPGLTVYFSYQTPVAFSCDGKLVVRKNDWGPTTGKHLGWLDGGNKKNRLPAKEFQEQLEKAWDSVRSN